jgi:hypothetical protein
VAVLGSGQGSGALIGQRMVLTAWHVIEGDDAVRVAHPSGRAPVPCQVLWKDSALDAALLLTEEDVISAERAAPLGLVRVGEVATRSPLPHCQIVGFPQTQRYGERGEDLEYDQYRATVLPMAGRLRNVLVCELDQPAAAERDGRTSPVQGLSGAPVFAGAVLLGIVTQVPRDRHHLRIEAVSVEDVLKAATIASFESPLERITDVHPDDDQFEDRYAADLSSQYRKTEIFGIDELGRSEARWDLDTAYLSLEAHGAHGTTRQRIDTLLTARPRVLLRGEAGAGKTTLVWWLAAHAANSTLGEDLAELNGLVPFVVPLREVHARGGRFPAVSELLSAGRVITDDPPDGWARRVLEAGRGLLLVDGLDEVPERERKEARRWLTALLDRYPRTRCLATVRPNAVSSDWLAQDGFDELTLLPMSDDDIRAFVRAWHDAARLECDHLYDIRRGGDERELLTTLEQGLVHQLDENAALSDLARTPLLCAVICALHRRRGGLLPTTRWLLYQAALAMLLGGRDAGRGVRDTNHLSLDSGEQHALLQRLAIWLARTGQQQMTHAQAVQQLGLAMRDMPQISAKGTPEDVLRFLLDRSGLLQERTDDAIQFIHRTFQDFLAAKEFHESGYILELLKHAREEAWRDVIVLAVGHATRKDAHHLIERLVEYGDAAEPEHARPHFHMLAAWCATSLLSLDAALMETVRERVRALMPPARHDLAVEVARLGDWVLELLPGPEELDEEGVFMAAQVLMRIRTPRARRAFRAFASVPACNVLVVDGWDLHPVDEYAREVLEGAHLSYMDVSTRSRLAHLPCLGSVTDVGVHDSFTAQELDACLPTRGLRALWLQASTNLASFDFLRSRVDLEDLGVYVASLRAEQFEQLRGVPGLRSLDLTGTPLDGWSGLVAHPGVRRLTVRSDDAGWLTGLAGWGSLESLCAAGNTQYVPEVLRAVSGVPHVSRLEMRITALDGLAAGRPVPQLRSVSLSQVQEPTDMAQVCRVFPNLEALELQLHSVVRHDAPLDLTPLLDRPGLRVTLTGSSRAGVRVVGAELFGDRLSDKLSYGS